jgi:TatA/E family protein of Tat protein translocase
MPFGLGFGETVLILAVILLFFGPKRLPDAAASLGRGIREFKRAIGGIGEELTQPRDLASTPLPPHSTFAGPGADPYAVPFDAPGAMPDATGATVDATVDAADAAVDGSGEQTAAAERTEFAADVLAEPGDDGEVGRTATPPGHP